MNTHLTRFWRRTAVVTAITVSSVVAQSSQMAAQTITISGTIYNDPDGGTISGTPISKVNNQQLYVYLIDSTNKVVDAAVVNEFTGTYMAYGSAYNNYNVALSANVQQIGTVYPNLGLPNNYVPTAEGTTVDGDGTPDFAVAINSASNIVINYAIDARPEGYAYVIQRPTYDSLRRIIIPAAAFGGEDLEDGNYLTGLTGRLVDLFQATGGALYYNDTLINFSSASAATRISNFQSSALRFVPTSTTVRAFAYSIVDNAGVVELVPNSVSISVPLPITLTSFYGVAGTGGNKLIWQTATETNSAGFELQRSTNGKDFTKLAYIGSQAENGRSMRTLEYSFTDNNSTGRVFYRLRQIDLSGESMISNTISMNGAASGNNDMQFSVYPNPCSSALAMDLNAGEHAALFTITITSAAGQTIATRQLEAPAGRISTSFDLSTVPNGQYFVRLSTSGGVQKTTSLTVLH